MSHTRPPANLPAPVAARHLDRRLTGSPAYVSNVVETLRNDGRLLAASPPRPVPGDDRRVFATVRFLDTPAPVVSTPRRRWPIAVAAITGCAAVLAGLGWAVAQLVHAITASAPAIAGALFLVLLVAWLLAGRAGVCAGLHCPGCPHR